MATANVSVTRTLRHSPGELAERCIKAGTSERGCCAACGKPWVQGDGA